MTQGEMETAGEAESGSHLVLFSVHPEIRNKPSAWEPAFATSWARRHDTLQALRQHITSGGAFICAAMTSPSRTSSAFESADLVAVDIDHGLTLEQFQSNPLAERAFMVYTTSSHNPAEGQHRFRILFRLPRVVSDAATYKALATLLLEALGGDRSCSDPCRLFYGNDDASVPLWQPEACLEESLLEAAATKARETRWSQANTGGDYDDQTLEQAIFVLEQVLDPTSDGQRELFVRVTAAAASGGEVLYPAWSDWATRGHHGKGKNAKQATKRFFKGFSGRTSLATLFYLASEQDPDWRTRLPDELRSSCESPGWSLPAVGYDPSDFLGYDEYLALQELDVVTPAGGGSGQAGKATQSLLDYSAPVIDVIPVATPAPIVSVADSEEEEDDEGDQEDLYEAELIDTPTPVRRQGAPRGGVAKTGFEVEDVKSRLLHLYPGLRLNILTLQLEFGPRDQPCEVPDPSTAYVRVSRGLEKAFPKTLVFDTAQVIGWENRYNPVVTYLEHCAASRPPCPYFDQIATELLGVQEEGLYNPRMPDGSLLANTIVRRFLIGAVARAINPGCSHGWMPILVGGQNVGKSNFLQYLTPPLAGSPDIYPWASTIQQGIGSVKERPHILHSGWIVLLDEVERYFRRRYTEELKNLITVPVDRSARKYENERAFPRAFVLAGATNSSDFFVDPTGNRRFMPIVVLGKVPSPEDPSIRIIDLDRLKRDRDSIWAAAYKEYLAGSPHEFTSFELAHLAEYMSNFSADSPLAAPLQRVLAMNVSGIDGKGHSFYALSDIFDWLDVPLDRRQQMAIQVTDQLKQMGYRTRRMRIGSQYTRVWSKTE